MAHTLCEISAGFALQCKDGIGGIKNLYLGKWSDFGPSITINPTTGYVTSMGANDIYKFYLPKHTANFEQTGNMDINNGTVFYTQTITATFHKLNNERSLQLQELAKMRMVAVVEDNNGNFFVFGVVDAVEVTAMTAPSGTAKSDLNGYTITFTAEEKTLAPMFPTFLDDMSIVDGSI